MAEQRLFISHASEDAAVADKIVAYLESRGVPCWISSRDIPPRAIYADAIVDGIEGCNACVVLVSAGSNASKAVKREVELASHADKAFIPIRIDGSEPAKGLAYYLRNTQWIEYKVERDRALDRIVAHLAATTAPEGSTPPPRTHTPQPPLVFYEEPGLVHKSGAPRVTLIVAGIAAMTLGAWFVWSQLLSPATPPRSAEVSAETLAPLLGSYNWEGVECGRGPTITHEDRTLVFTMPDTPAFRHEVLSATTATDDDGYALRVETRVAAPADAAGQNYILGLTGDTLMVMTVGRGDMWTRCEVTPATGPVTAVRTPSVANTTWRFHDGGLVAFRADGTFVDSACNYGVWRQTGDEVTIDRNDGWTATARLVNDRLVEFGYVGTEQRASAASPADHTALSCSP